MHARLSDSLEQFSTNEKSTQRSLVVPSSPSSNHQQLIFTLCTMYSQLMSSVWVSSLLPMALLTSHLTMAPFWLRSMPSSRSSVPWFPGTMALDRNHLKQRHLNCTFSGSILRHLISPVGHLLGVPMSLAVEYDVLSLGEGLMTGLNHKRKKTIICRKMIK